MHFKMSSVAVICPLRVNAQHGKRVVIATENSEGPNQPVLPHNLIRIFTDRRYFISSFD